MSFQVSLYLVKSGYVILYRVWKY